MCFKIGVGHDKPDTVKSSPTCHSSLQTTLRGLFYFSAANVMDAAYKTKRPLKYGLSLVMCQIRRAPMLFFLDFDGLRTLLALLYFEYYFLAFAQGLETLAFNGAEMHENILPVTYFDETVTFLLVKPLHSTVRHCRFPFT